MGVRLNTILSLGKESLRFGLLNSYEFREVYINLANLIVFSG